MERPRGFFTKRTEHYNNIQKEENNKKKAIEQSLSLIDPEKVKQEHSPSPKVENLDPNKTQSKTPSRPNERPLKCLETLAQKAGITFDEKYEMEKSQSPAQQVQQQQQQQQQQNAMMQLTQEQYQQIQQQFQLQAFANSAPTIHVKQEYATQQQQQQPQGITAADLKNLQDQQMQQMQIVQESPQSPHQNSQNALQQAVQAGQVSAADWQHGRVQVLQQPLQNAQYLSQMYSPQLVMSAGNLLHAGLGQQQQIQLIAGKPFQGQLTPQMLNGKPVLTSGGQASFSNYTLPTAIPSSQAQTLLFSPILNGVVSSQQQNQQSGQQNVLPTMQNQSTPTKSDGQKQIQGKQILQKVSQAGTQQQQTVTGTVANHQQGNQQQCVQVSQTMPTAQIIGGQMQFASPWQIQGMPFWQGMQPQALLTTTASNPIFIRGTNPDGTPGMFIQQSPTQTTQQTVQSPHNQISLVGNIAQTATQKVRPATDGNLAPKTQQTQQRAAPILPQGVQIRPASSVSTQTAMNQNASLMAKTPKVRTKQTPVRPAAPIKVSLNQQTGQPMMQQVVTTQGGVNKMVVMGNINGQFQPVLQQNAAQQIIANNDKLKSQQQQQVIIQQAMANIQQQNAQQQHLQQQLAQIQLQHQQQQFLQQAGQAGQLMAQNGNIQQVVLQHQQQLPTVTVTSGVSQQQSMPAHLTQQGIMTKAVMQSVAHSASGPSPVVTSIAGNITADTSNSILGPLTSPQTLLQPPQNPLIAMTTMSTSPMSSSLQKEKSDAASGESAKPLNVTMSPSKRPAEDTKQNEAKKVATEESKKTEEASTVSTSTGMSSPKTPGTPTKAAAVNSPLAAQNGESELKKTPNSNTPMLKNELPKAMVKPNVLTHVIEGYVIQESNEPFPVTRQRYSEKENDEPPKKKQAVEEVKTESPKVNGESSTSTNVTSSTAPPLPSDMVPCEQCGKTEMRSKLKKKRFCSLVCARARKSVSTDGSSSITNGSDEKQEISAQNDKPKAEGENGEIPPIEEHVMLKWSVTQVCDFIKNLPGCSDYAEDFKLQEIDGQALLLLKENHLVSAMGMKLGPALKIVNKIESMRVSQDGEVTETPPEQQ